MGQTGELTRKKEKEDITELKLVLSKIKQRNKKNKISEWKISDLLFNFKLPNTHTIGVSEEERKDGTGKMFE